jgi:hypothetical protein
VTVTPRNEARRLRRDAEAQVDRYRSDVLSCDYRAVLPEADREGAFEQPSADTAFLRLRVDEELGQLEDAVPQDRPRVAEDPPVRALGDPVLRGRLTQVLIHGLPARPGLLDRRVRGVVRPECPRAAKVRPDRPAEERERHRIVVRGRASKRHFGPLRVQRATRLDRCSGSGGRRSPGRSDA